MAKTPALASTSSQRIETPWRRSTPRAPSSLPATPYTESVGLTEALGRARLLTMRGDGHTAYGGNSPCIDRWIDRYVLTTKLPPAGTGCSQNVPFPPKGASSSAASSGVRRAVPSAPLGAPFAGVR